MDKKDFLIVDITEEFQLKFDGYRKEKQWTLLRKNSGRILDGEFIDIYHALSQFLLDEERLAKHSMSTVPLGDWIFMPDFCQCEWCKPRQLDIAAQMMQGYWKDQRNKDFYDDWISPNAWLAQQKENDE